MAQPSARPRVVSLIASATEIVSALGYEDCLVGRSHECDYPESVAALPACTAPRFSTDGSSADIDREVQETLARALSVYRVDTDRLSALEPDVLITQSQCNVCAVSLADVETALCTWVKSRPRLVSLQPNTLADVFADIVTVAEGLGDRQAGERLAAELRSRIADVAAHAIKLAKWPRVATVEWIEPYMAAGNWVPELIALAGGENVLGTAGRHSPRMPFETLVSADPDVIVVFPCGFDIPRTLRELPLLADRADWKALRAVREGRVYAADGNQYFNRPGPRVVESLEILAEILHPDEFRFGHEGRGWVRVPA
ncbi:MAG: cobalamin-binding protein [Alphaproteobacteria bacterium]